MPVNVAHQPVVFDHPLIQHKLATIRQTETGHEAFRRLLHQIAGLMVYEMTRTLPTEPVEVRTPLETTTATRLAAPLTVVPVLRAGLAMAEGVLDMMPEARVGHIGMYRDEKTLQPVPYLTRLPSDVGAGPVIVADPMLATGGSAAFAAKVLRDHGVSDLRFVCLVAVPEGIERLLSADPELRIYCAALDRQLDERGFIRPGLGDAGDRLYGTI